MSARWGVFRIGGEAWLTLETVAECYDCDSAWLHEAWGHGLLGAGLPFEGRVLVHVAVLDRVAEVVRLGRHHGLPFEAIALLVGPDPAEAVLTAVVVDA